MLNRENEYTDREPLEYMSGEAYFRYRLGQIETEAQEMHGIRFLAGLELDLQIYDETAGMLPLEHPQVQALLSEEPENGAQDTRSTRLGLLFPEETASPLSKNDQAELLDATRGAMKKLAQTQGKDESVSYSRQDVINFLLYQEFSHPASTAPKVGASLDETQTDLASTTGWLEFRFGKGSMQQGYYDSPGISELRLQPCALSELVQREEIIKKRIVEIAALLGCIVAKRGSHVNISCYKEDEATWQPLFGKQDHQIQPTLHALGGLVAAIEDGAPLTPDLLREDFFKHGHTAWTITPFRTSMRAKDGYFELREQHLIASTSHALLWLATAITEGIANPEQTRARGTVRPLYQTDCTPSRTDKFDKSQDLHLLRALELASVNGDGQIILSDDYSRNNATTLIADWTGIQLPQEAALFASIWLASHITVNQEGTLEIDTAYADEHYRLLPTALCDLLDEELQKQQLEIGDLVQKFASYLAKGAVRYKMQTGFFASPFFPKKTAEQWRQTWLTSPIVQRAYREDASLHAKRLHDVVQSFPRLTNDAR